MRGALTDDPRTPRRVEIARALLDASYRHPTLVVTLRARRAALQIVSGEPIARIDLDVLRRAGIWPLAAFPGRDARGGG